MNAPHIQHEGELLRMPGLASVHSHTFQRALRGRTQRRVTANDSFWSWRGLMYNLAERINLEQLYALAHFACVELAMSGVTALGEFHYVQHQPNGQPYSNRQATADTVIQAATDAGLRICLIRAAYLRAGYGQELAPAQQRFVDPQLDLVLADIEALRTRYADNPLVSIGVAAHSIRAVPLPQVIELANYARTAQLPLHMHVAEQRRELQECQAEYGTTPVDLLAQYNILDERFVAIHATHLSQTEIAQLGAARAFIGLCRTTERDLGDGAPDTAALVQAGARLCFGVDSHASSDAFEEIRAAELDMRTKAEARVVAAEAPELLDAATRLGYHAIGFPNSWQDDYVLLRANDPALASADQNLLSDAVIFGATPRAVEHVSVAGQTIVEHGVHRNYTKALPAFRQALAELH